jgi:aminopeptidase N
MPLLLDDADAATRVQRDTGGQLTMVLELTKAQQTFRFLQVWELPVPSLLRDFSAPVILEYDYSDEELAFLMARDSDAFNRWEAGQRLAMRRLLGKIAGEEGAGALDPLFVESFRSILNDAGLDPAYREAALTLPSEAMIAEAMDVVDPQAIAEAREFVRLELAHQLRDDWLLAYQGNLTPGSYSPDHLSAGRRALKNLSLSYLARSDDSVVHDMVWSQVQNANNMTDRIAALGALVNGSSPNKEAALVDFYREFENEALVIDKWFTLQATARTMTVEGIRELMRHPAFTLTNPNRARSLLFAFCNANPANFHSADGSGYVFWAEQVITLDAINPQVAARLARSLDRWRKFVPHLQKKMKSALQHVTAARKLSRDVAEVVGKALTA